MNETNIGRPRLHPSFAELIRAVRERTFMEQRWLPACARCGERAERDLSVAEARAWWTAHRERCVPLEDAA